MDILYTKAALTPINKDFVDFLTKILKTALKVYDLKDKIHDQRFKT